LPLHPTSGKVTCRYRHFGSRRESPAYEVAMHGRKEHLSTSTSRDPPPLCISQALDPRFSTGGFPCTVEIGRVFHCKCSATIPIHRMGNTPRMPRCGKEQRISINPREHLPRIPPLLRHRQSGGPRWDPEHRYAASIRRHLSTPFCIISFTDVLEALTLQTITSNISKLSDSKWIQS
jgi:hypothetical protein